MTSLNVNGVTSRQPVAIEAVARPDAQTPQKVIVPERMPSEPTTPKFTAAEVEKDCPVRLQQIGREITERTYKVEKQFKLATDHAIAVEELLAEAKGLCDRGGFNKFRELYCPKLAKSQAYALRAIAAGKKTGTEHRTEERERKRRTRANQNRAKFTGQHTTLDIHTSRSCNSKRFEEDEAFRSANMGRDANFPLMGALSRSCG